MCGRTMSLTREPTSRPLSVYLTAQVVGVPLALAAGWVLLAVGVPLWGAALPWLLLTAHLSRKRLPSEAVGSALHLVAAVAVLWPLAYIPRVEEGEGVVTLARELFGPALVLLVAGAAAYAVGLVLKRRAARELARRARSDPSLLE